MIAHINIGSNRGDSKALIGQAVAAIAARWPQARLCVSRPFVSPAWGYESHALFTNVGVALQLNTIMAPLELLHHLLDIQNSISTAPHRNPDGSYCDRELDIDLIAIDSLVVDTPELTLPHPRMHLRPFVLVPLAQLAPRWCHPTLHLSPNQLLARLRE